MKKIFALSFAISLALVGCSTGTNAPGEESTGSGWTDENRQAFIDSCLETSAGETEFCECSQQKLESLYTIDQIEEIEQGLMDDPEAIEEFQDVLSACVAFLE